MEFREKVLLHTPHLYTVVRLGLHTAGDSPIARDSTPFLLSVRLHTLTLIDALWGFGLYFQCCLIEDSVA
jgi:hypothetical protein